MFTGVAQKFFAHVTHWLSDCYRMIACHPRKIRWTANLALRIKDGLGLGSTTQITRMITLGSHSLSISCRRLFVPLVIGAASLCAQSASALVYYSIDDGSANDSVGEGGPNGGDVLFLNEFPVAPNGQTIASISVAFGDPSETTNSALLGLPYTVLLYSDPSGTGNPDDATLIAFAGGVITSVDTNTFLTTPITPTNVTTSDFFVGFELQNQPPNTFPAAIDTDAPTYPDRSYVTYGASGTINPFDLAANQVPPETIESVPGAPAGNWLIRANMPVPEPSTWAYVMSAVAGGCLLFRRRARA